MGIIGKFGMHTLQLFNSGRLLPREAVLEKARIRGEGYLFEMAIKLMISGSVLIQLAT